MANQDDQTLPRDREGQAAYFATERIRTADLIAGPGGPQTYIEEETGKQIVGNFICPACEGSGWFSLLNSIRCEICEGVGLVGFPADSIKTMESEV